MAHWGDLAGRLPMDVVSELVGVPEADRDELRRLSDLLVHREPGVHDVPPAGIDAAIVDGSTGLLVAPGDVPALTAAVRQLLDDPALLRKLLVETAAIMPLPKAKKARG